MIEEALKLKDNYTEAMVLLIQIDIDAGNVEQAIETTQSIVRLEPNNPTRYFQLGVLFSSQGNVDAAESLYRQALAIDPSYANARYLLALLLVQKGSVDEALSELYVVRETNQNNEQLNLLISRLESGEDIDDIVELANLAVRREVPTVDTFNDAITAPVNEDSDLVVPVNQEFYPEGAEISE
jgi:tetratricopeptide (TPR) repeat protein